MLCPNLEILWYGQDLDCVTGTARNGRQAYSHWTRESMVGRENNSGGATVRRSSRVGLRAERHASNMGLLVPEREGS